jgi:hypothetical protein
MKKYVFGVVGLVLGVLMVWLLFRSTNWEEVGHALSGADYFLLALSLVPYFLAHPARVIRWGYIVRAVYPATFRQMFSATQIGFLANFVLPGRAGEAVRALVLTRLTRVPFSKSFAFVAVDRLTDLFGLIVVMAVSLLAFQPTGGVSIPPETFGTERPIGFSQGEYRAGAIGAGVFLAVLIAGFVGLYTNRGVVLWISTKVFGLFSKRVADFVNGMINHFADGLHVFRSPAEMAKSIGWSFITWGLNLAGLSIGMAAFHVDFPWYTPVVMQAILAVFIAAPNTPGFVGQFHIPIVLALVMTVPGVDINTAKAYAIAAHLSQLPPVFMLGIWCLMRDNLNLFQLQREGEEKAKEEKHE